MKFFRLYYCRLTSGETQGILVRHRTNPSNVRTCAPAELHSAV